jgi:ABC-type dipeptide/oligopeptide/nickel transport system permease subunit
MSNTTSDDTKILEQPGQEEENPFEVLEEEPLPPVNEFKRFMRVFFRRKVVIFGAVLVLIVLVMGIFPKQIAPNDPYKMDLMQSLQPPSLEFPLGTDELGRCLFSRIVYGARFALLTGVLTVAVSSIIGTFLGLLAGFSGKRVEELIMRFCDAWISIPSMFLIMIVSMILQRGLLGIVIAVGVGGFPGYIRIVYGQVMTVKQNDYIMASLAMGDSKLRIMFKHILPNVISPLIVTMASGLSGAVMAEAGLSFIGLGIQPPEPAWGTMTNNGFTQLQSHPLLSLAPGLAIVLIVFGFNMIGDGIRDALDPKMRGTLE